MMHELQEGPSPADIVLDTVSVDTGPFEVSRLVHRTAYCFTCRRETTHFQVLRSTESGSYWGPKIDIECGECGIFDADVFPGRVRNYG